MNIHYKIVEAWPNDHLIVARYWTDILTEEMLASDSSRKEDGKPVRCRTDVSMNLPIPVPTVEELDKILKTGAPTGWLKMMEDVINPDINTDLSSVVSKFYEKKSVALTDIEELLKSQIPEVDVRDNNQDLTENDIQRLIDNLKK
jgi:hypothetical protein